MHFYKKNILNHRTIQLPKVIEIIFQVSYGIHYYDNIRVYHQISEQTKAPAEETTNNILNI